MIPADLRSVVYWAVARSASDSECECLFKLYRETDQHEEKIRILRSLGAMKQAAFIDRVLSFAISDEVRSQDLIFVLAGASGSAHGREKAWIFMQENSRLLINRYTGSPLISRMVRVLTLVCLKSKHII